LDSKLRFILTAKLWKVSRKTLPERRYEELPQKAWYVPARPQYAGRMVWFADQFKFRLTEAADEFIHKALMMELEAQRAEVEVPKLIWIGEFQPVPFQIRDIQYCLQNGRVLIANPTGTGKTIEAICTMEQRRSYPAVIVVPGTQVYKWEEEIKKWLPHRPTLVLDTHAIGAPLYADIFIISYDSVHKWEKKLRNMEPAMIIMDELQKVKNPDSRRTMSLKTVMRETNPPNRLGLSATPVINNVVELLTELNILGVIHWFGGYWNFAFRYCNAKYQFGRYEMVGFNQDDPGRKRP
jgi:hypothetical protein